MLLLDHYALVGAALVTLVSTVAGVRAHLARRMYEQALIDISGAADAQRAQLQALTALHESEAKRTMGQDHTAQTLVAAQKGPGYGGR